MTLIILKYACCSLFLTMPTAWREGNNSRSSSSICKVHIGNIISWVWGKPGIAMSCSLSVCLSVSCCTRNHKELILGSPNMTHMLGHTGMDVSWVRTVKGQGHRVRKIGGCSLALCSLEYLSSFVLCIIRMVDYTCASVECMSRILC